MCQFPRLRINCLETYKRIVRNATESPLLRLPPATSNQIWREVSGDRLVHISCYLPGENNDITGDGDQNTAEKEPMEKWTRLVYDYKSLHWPGWHGRYSEAIYSCGPRSSPFSHDTTIRLNVLRSCRQIYVEADEIFWTSNTFSFANGVTFERFMANRRIQQRRLIRSLRLEMSWRNTDISVWNKALSTTMVSSFSGLHTLRLQIDHDMVSWAWHKVKHFFLDRTSFCDGLRRLSTLPLKKVEVAVRPVPDEDLFMRTCLGWRQKDRKMVAIGVRKILLDSQSAEEINAEIRQRRRERQEMLSRGVEMLPSAGLPTSYLSCLGNNHNDGPS